MESLKRNGNTSMRIPHHYRAYVGEMARKFQVVPKLPAKQFAASGGGGGGARY
jgi:hypothetical protein